jgi:hypothetical protein
MNTTFDPDRSSSSYSIADMLDIIRAAGRDEFNRYRAELDDFIRERFGNRSAMELMRDSNTNTAYKNAVRQFAYDFVRDLFRQGIITNMKYDEDYRHKYANDLIRRIIELDNEEDIEMLKEIGRVLGM